MDVLFGVDADIYPKHLLAVHQGAHHLLIDEIARVEYAEQLLEEVGGVGAIPQRIEFGFVLLADRYPSFLLFLFADTKITVRLFHDLEELVLDQITEPVELSLELPCLLTIAFWLLAIHESFDIDSLRLEQWLHVDYRMLQLFHIAEHIGSLAEPSTCRFKRRDSCF